MLLDCRFLRLFCILWIASVAIRCLAEPPSGAPQPSTPPPERSEKAVPVVEGDYHLANHDVVKISVFQEDELTTTTRIGEDGLIHFPLIGDVEIAGKTVRQAAVLIETLLKKRFLVNPQVSISITEFVKKRFTVLGQVKNPGSYEVPAAENLDLIQAIGMAGGYTRSANQGKILIKRLVDGSERVYKVNGKELAHGEGAKGFRVVAGDTITVEESFF